MTRVGLESDAVVVRISINPMRTRKNKNWLSWMGLGGLATAAALAGEVELNFNTDPSLSGLYNTFGVPVWRPNGGASGADGDGYLSITDALAGQSGSLVFNDLEDGLVVKAFRFEVDLRIGGGHSNPADGFSINYASDDDAATTGMNFAGTDGEPTPGLPEEGTRTGLAIGFDTWQSGLIGPVQDVVGLSIRVDGALIAQLPVPLLPDNVYLPTHGTPGNQGDAYTYDPVPYRNAAVDSANYLGSMQTGAMNPDLVDQPQPIFFEGDTEWPRWMENLVWERFVMELTEESTVMISWKGVELTPPGGLPVSFSARPGRIIFAARTGDNFEAHHVDNLRLVTVPADDIILGVPTGHPIGFDLGVVDSGPAILDPETLVLNFNGEEVSPTSVTKDGPTTTISYRDATNPLPSGSTQTVEITATDTRGISQTVTHTFVVPTYIELPATAAAEGVNTSEPGFNFRVHQASGPESFPAAPNQDNSISRTEQQLKGMRGDNIANQFGAVDGVFAIPGVVNFEQESLAAGSFNADNGYPDGFIPGIPGNFGTTDNIAGELTTYVHFPQAGVWNLHFVSDDGFRTTLGFDAMSGTILSQLEGVANSTVTLYIGTPGYYPMRTIWYEGGGGAHLEWSATGPDGVRYLLNDTTMPNALRTYRSATGVRPSYVSFVNPVRGSGGVVLPSVPLTIDIRDGSAAVDQGSIVLTINDEEVTPDVSKSGDTTSVVYDWPTPPASGLVVNVGLEFSDANGEYSGAYSYTIHPYTMVPAHMRMATGVDMEEPGFAIRLVQADTGRANSVMGAESHLAGFLGWPDTKNTTGFGPDGFYVESGVLNYDQGSVAAGHFRSNRAATDFIPYTTPDTAIPGIPGTATSGTGTDNITAEILTVVEFPTAGWYVLGFNSDDGFRTSIGHPNDQVRLTLGQFDAGRGSAGDAIFPNTGIFYAFQIPEAGLYPMRSIWFEGGGGANLEWFSYDPDSRILTLLNGVEEGSLKTYQYPRESAGPPHVASIVPRPGAVRAGTQVPINIVIADGVGNIDTASVSLSINGEVVPATIAKTGGNTTVTYLPEGGMAPATAHNVALSFGGRTINYTFTTGALTTASFFIEAEDFDFGSGQSDPTASDMATYRGGAYGGRGAVSGVDYSRPTQADSPLYRFGEDPQVAMDMTGDVSRVFTSVDFNFKIGWTGAGHWYNYTRTFPEGSYNVFAGLSHGDAAATMSATMQSITAGAGTAVQTVEELGTFTAPGTGGWGSNALVPLVDGDGAPVELALGGSQTVRFTTANGDYDFILFVPAGEVSSELEFTSVVLNADGTITLEWIGGGTLQVAPTVDGPWTDVPGAASGLTLTPSEDQQYGRLRP